MIVDNSLVACSVFNHLCNFLLLSIVLSIVADEILKAVMVSCFPNVSGFVFSYSDDNKRSVLHTANVIISKLYFSIQHQTNKIYNPAEKTITFCTVTKMRREEKDIKKEGYKEGRI